jgi:hypothetical protein
MQLHAESLIHAAVVLYIGFGATVNLGSSPWVLFTILQTEENVFLIMGI